MTSTAQGLSLDELWMPFTANRAFKKNPRLLASASGMYYTDVDGNRILDGTAGLWCVNAGHCRQPIVEAIARTAGELDYAPGFNMGHPLQFELAARIAPILPAGLSHSFFTNSGSEAVDTALKIAIAWHAARGQPERVRFIGRARGYHGVGFGGLSVGGIDNNRKAFLAHLLPNTDAHLPQTHGLPGNFYSRGQPAEGVELADKLEEMVGRYGAETIAAVIVEPVAGSAGVLVPPRGYLEKLRSICDRHGILLIFDEVITGFGRVGASFASEHFRVTPDLMTVAKGITNGAVPMGAVFVKRAIYDAVLEAAESGIEFFHGYTYSGHPLACAAAMATLDLYRDEGLFERAASMASLWEEAVHSLRGTRHVIDIRNLGLVAGIELDPRPTRPGTRAMDVHVACFREGVLIRTTGDIIALSPPLIIEQYQIEEIVATIRKVLERTD
ncbi:MAG: aspartate aminotransferase family protein [Gemmatimonadota bacterium]